MSNLSKQGTYTCRSEPSSLILLHTILSHFLKWEPSVSSLHQALRGRRTGWDTQRSCPMALSPPFIPDASACYWAIQHVKQVGTASVGARIRRSKRGCRTRH